MACPDCLGLVLTEALQLLEGCSAGFDIKKAEPFFKGRAFGVAEGLERVIGQKEEGGKLVLTVCTVPPEGNENER